MAEAPQGRAYGKVIGLILLAVILVAGGIYLSGKESLLQGNLLDRFSGLPSTGYTPTPSQNLGFTDLGSVANRAGNVSGDGSAADVNQGAAVGQVNSGALQDAGLVADCQSAELVYQANAGARRGYGTIADLGQHFANAGRGQAFGLCAFQFTVTNPNQGGDWASKTMICDGDELFWSNDLVMCTKEDAATGEKVQFRIGQTSNNRLYAYIVEFAKGGMYRTETAKSGGFSLTQSLAN